MTSEIAHLDVVVCDLERSAAFYGELLAPLGWRTHGTIVGERGERVVYLQAAHGTQLGLREPPAAAARPRPPDRYDVGMHHLAFGADSREVVRDRARWLRDRGARLESGPQEYDYAPGYYSVFFLDPDGLKLEVLHLPRSGNGS
jgi:catechol 2,3-dioxygenase-like lactoylglutathione lyase family enzyme